MNSRTLALAAAIVALISLPYWMPGVYYVNVSSQVLFYAVFAMGLNILVGYAGLVSLGHAGLFGIAAYATGYLLQIGFGHTAAILGALIVGLVATAIFAALALRATGIGFIMITAQGFAAVMQATGEVEGLVNASADLFSGSKAAAARAARPSQCQDVGTCLKDDTEPSPLTFAHAHRSSRKPSKELHGLQQD